MQEINYTRGYARIDLDAMEHNIDVMNHSISTKTKMMLIIKADGYGHGATKIANTFENKSCIWGFGVATMDEGILLRNAGIKKPILVLGCVFPGQYEEALLHDLRINIYTEEMAQFISDSACALNKKAKIHIKIDSGMSRIGFLCNKNSIESIVKISKLPNIEFEGIFTHFSKADETDKTHTIQQCNAFSDTIQALENLEITFPYKHCSNSAAIIDHPNYNMNIVRAGISLYGLYPSEEVKKENIALEPVLSFKSVIASIKEIEEGTMVSYGGTFVAPRTMKIAMIPIGYADGYPRSLSNVGYVLINGKKAPILGRICMDQFIVDISEIAGAEFMTDVVLIGNSGMETISVEELGDLSGKFNYEFVCGINKRIPRIYIKGGETTDQVDYFA